MGLTRPSQKTTSPYPVRRSSVPSLHPLPGLLAGSLLGCLAFLATAHAQTSPAAPVAPATPPKPKAPDLPNDALFAGFVPKIELLISPENIDKLAKDPKNFVECSIKEYGGLTLEKCSVKLKGSAGSFRQINDPRPGFSVRTDKVKKGQEFRGVGKFQLNNFAQDGTMLHEQIAGEMARKAFVPASRCTHAYLLMNGKVLGTYLLKEGFNDEFLKYFFKDTRGHLYDGGFVSEVNPNTECDRGNPNDKTRLLELIGACNEPKPDVRLARMDKVLDIDAYFRYVFVESVLTHWDGYSFNRNNYRFYEDPTTGKFHFILHGMDQTWGDPRWYVFRQPNAMVSNALWNDRAMRERFRAQCFLVWERAIRPVDWPRRAEQVAADLKSKIRTFDKADAAAFEGRGRDAANQIRARLDGVKAQMEDALKLRTPGGKMTLGKYAWSPSSDKGDTVEGAYAGRDCLILKVGPNGGGDFRLQLSVSPGRYRLEGKIQHKGVKAGEGDAKGLRLRSSGSAADPKNPAAVGDGTWKGFAHEFTVTDADPVLIAELRGTGGEAGVDRSSLTLTRLP